MPDQNRSVLQGTVDLLILKTLSWGPRHGYAIARWIEETTDDALRIEEGSLYPALYRMQKRGWIKSGWGESDIGKRIRIYSLTPSGRAELLLDGGDDRCRWLFGRTGGSRWRWGLRSRCGEQWTGCLYGLGQLSCQL